MREERCAAHWAQERELLATCEEQLGRPDTHLTDEYLQLAVLFGIVTMFAPVFPMGCFFALVHALISRSSDGWKFLRVNRRLLPRPNHDGMVTETWLGIFEALAVLQVVVNVAVVLVAHPDDHSVAQLVIFEHGLLFFRAYLAWSIPDRPEWIVREERLFEQAVRREEMISDDPTAGPHDAYHRPTAGHDIQAAAMRRAGY